MTRQEWLGAHPFLGPVARLHDQVDAALDGLKAAAPPSAPPWDAYVADYDEGVPLLRSPGAAVDLEPAAALTLELLDRLSAGPAREPITGLAVGLRAELGRDPAPVRRVADGLLGEPPEALSSPGLLRWVGWTAASRALQPVLHAFAGWRSEDRWQRSHCPACGAAPAMAQLIGVEPGFVRFLSCGCCRTRWRWRRTACPFCESDPHRLAIVALQSEPSLRIDHCESCKGYLKTYVGRGDESVMLADWTSPHLDLVARDRGLERRALSLYDLSALLDAPR